MINNNQSGFTVIELLITLFIAVAFLVSGYQLYNVIIQSGGDARAQARATSTANDYLQDYKSSATEPCVTQTPLANQSIDVAGLSNVTISVAITCPYPSSPAVSKIESIVTYDTDNKEVKMATYNSPNSSTSPTITNGLVGWWTFNGDALDQSSNGNNGTINGATETTDQNGIPNKAYNFSESGSYVDAGTSATLSFSDNFTLAAWIRPTGYHTLGYYGLKNGILGKGPATTYNYALQATDSTTISFIKRTGSEGLQFYNFTGIPNLTNAWTHVVVTAQSGTLTLYRNGSLFGTKSVGTIAGVAGDRSLIGAIGTSNEEVFFIGDIDDVRIYNRALPATEVAQLYNGGAY